MLTSDNRLPKWSPAVGGRPGRNRGRDRVRWRCLASGPSDGPRAWLLSGTPLRKVSLGGGAIFCIV